MNRETGMNNTSFEILFIILCHTMRKIAFFTRNSYLVRILVKDDLEK